MKLRLQGVTSLMLQEKKIRQIAEDVATANLFSANFTSIASSTAVDSEGTRLYGS